MDLKTVPTDKRPDIILDLDRLKKNCNGNIDIVRELLAHLYQKSRPKWLAALQNAIASSSSEELQGVCHGMKGASATVFAWRISNLALEFEILAHDGEVERVSNRMVELQDAFEELALWIERHPELS
jgi:HPt (histidine-containing phosphotransfer) domain-containing protein